MRRLIDWLRPRDDRGVLLVGPLDRFHPASVMYRIAVWLSAVALLVASGCAVRMTEAEISAAAVEPCALVELTGEASDVDALLEAMAATGRRVEIRDGGKGGTARPNRVELRPDFAEIGVHDQVRHAAHEGCHVVQQDSSGKPRVWVIVYLISSDRRAVSELQAINEGAKGLRLHGVSESNCAAHVARKVGQVQERHAVRLDSGLTAAATAAIVRASCRGDQ